MNTNVNTLCLSFIKQFLYTRNLQNIHLKTFKKNNIINENKHCGTDILHDVTIITYHLTIWAVFYNDISSRS